MILKNFDKVNTLITRAAQSGGHDPNKVKLLAVVKYAPDSQVLQLLQNTPVEHCGESKVQDAIKRWTNPEFALYRPKIKLHFIGHLQSNKAAKAVELFDYIDSVYTLDLARIISSRAREKGKTVKIMLQVNLTGKSTQGGAALTDLQSLYNEVKNLPNIETAGLMGIAPVAENTEELRPLFKEVYAVFSRVFPEGSELSLGMSGDFEVAVQEGATMPRIGSGLFGNGGGK